jgi:fructuronate reductase
VTPAGSPRSGISPSRLARHDGLPARRTVRIVHVGPGAFHRAHQAWYTDRAGDDWGIAAVTARSDDMVGRLGDQDGLYTLLTRSPDGDEASVVTSISEVVGHADPRGVDLLAHPDVTVATFTITEAGYAGSPVLARVVAGLDARRRADAGPMALLSCDNLVGNGAVLRDRVLELADRHDAGLAEWIAEDCAFPSTVVDRITPAAGAGDLAEASRLIGSDDRAAVVTEPWSEWIIEDAFAAGLARPAWERVGARLAPDVGPWERRKLRLLNAGHSLLAYLGGLRGHVHVHEAVADPGVHETLLSVWDEAREALVEASPLPGPDSGDQALREYCTAIEERWANARLPHLLAQIAADGSLKLRERLVPTVVSSRERGLEPVGCAVALGAWTAHVRGHGAVPLRDVRRADLAAAGGGPLHDAVPRLLALVDERLGGDTWLVDAVVEAARSLEA